MDRQCGTGTSGYRDYDRAHVVKIDGKPDFSAHPMQISVAMATRHNPEDMLVASLSTCHMLWYLHLAAEARLIVTAL